MPSSGSFVVCRGFFVFLGNVRRFEQRDLFHFYDFLELSLYYPSGFLDFSRNIYEL